MSEDRTPIIDFSLPPVEERITARTILLAWLACHEDDPGVHALALMALRLIAERDAERDTKLATLDLAAKVATQLGRTTNQSRELQDRLRDALDQNDRLNQGRKN